jgi:hypothetical protein
MSKGWIKLHRKLVEWQWYKKTNMTHLFIHLVLSANHEDNKWQGIEIKRGQLITGRKSLSEETGISEQSIRTCLHLLKSTNEITIKSTNKYSIITICNYDSYQFKDNAINQQFNHDLNQQPTSNQPATNQQPTTNKNDKNNKNEKKYKKELLSEIIISDHPNLNNEYLEIAKSFQALFIRNLSEKDISTEQAKKMKGSAIDDIRLAIEKDGHTLEDMRTVFRFLQKDEFWKKNVQSISTLRDKMTKLLSNARTNPTNANNSTEMNEYKQRIFNDLNNE